MQFTPSLQRRLKWRLIFVRYFTVLYCTALYCTFTNFREIYNVEARHKTDAKIVDIFRILPLTLFEFFNWQQYWQLTELWTLEYHNWVLTKIWEEWAKTWMFSFKNSELSLYPLLSHRPKLVLPVTGSALKTLSCRSEPLLCADSDVVF